MPTKLPMMGSWTLEGVACSSFLWARFSARLTVREGGSKLYENVILNNVTSASVPGPHNHLQLVEEIAKASERVIPIARLSPALARITLPRGRTVYGFPGHNLDDIARNYQHMIWWVSKHGLIMDVAHGRISEFDEYVGRQLFSAPRLRNGQFQKDLLVEIARSLDRRRFRPVRNVTGKCRDTLAEWNQRHPRKAIHTFGLALQCELPGVRIGIKKCFYRALAKFKKAYPDLSHKLAIELLSSPAKPQ